MPKQFNFKPIVASLVTFFILSMAVNPIVSAVENSSSLQRGFLSHSETNKVTVSYADLNLENKEDVQALYRRLQRASRKVCGSTYPGEDHQRIGACYRATLSNSVDKADNDDLTRIHAG